MRPLNQQGQPMTGAKSPRRLARSVLAAFLLTFLVARSLVLLIMTHRLPDLYLYVGETHIHHLNFGIFLLAGVGVFLLFRQPSGVALQRTAVLYGVGLALTFDEFGMWLHLGGSYWQRASLDAIVVVAAGLGLFIVAPRLKDFAPRHWWAITALTVAAVLFAWLVADSVGFIGRVIGPTLEGLESAQQR